MKYSLLLLLALCSISRISFADSAHLQPKILPGYVPEDSQTEKGIWMELEEYELAVKRSALLVKDEKLNKYVKTAACNVAKDYCNDIRIYIIRNPYFNASMTANGVMQVWTGLLVRVSSEDELAAVLGHELAHYTQLHSLDRLNRIKKNMTAGSVFDLGMILLTGENIPVGQLIATANAMAFSRDQEKEADLLGAKFMADANYDPRAAVKVWEMIAEEEENAAVKRREPGIFSSTHPTTSNRIKELSKIVSSEYDQINFNPIGRKKHIEMLNHNYMMLMEDQIDTNRFGRTESILRKHRQIGVNQNLTYFFEGEMYRQRDEKGDIELAKNAYMRAILGEKPIAEAYLNLGYIFLKEKNFHKAKINFSQYLDLKPDADDREMIEFYIQEY